MFRNHIMESKLHILLLLKTVMCILGSLSFAWLLLPPAPLWMVIEKFRMAPSSFLLCCLHLPSGHQQLPPLLVHFSSFWMTYLPYWVLTAHFLPSPKLRCSAEYWRHCCVQGHLFCWGFTEGLETACLLDKSCCMCSPLPKISMLDFLLLW